MIKDKFVHKDTFYQESYGGIPSHWAVQYYVNDDPFPEVRYFNPDDTDGVKNFEKELGVRE